jgi:prephenate dehydrogenase
MTPLVPRMTMAGVGLIGGSFAGALKRAGLVGEVLGLGRTAANLEVARARGFVDRVVTDPREAADVDLVVLGAPVAACVTLAERLAPHARPSTVLTDVGSVKGPLVAALEACWPVPARVVGAHPIAGGERSGAADADPDVFRGHLCILTPTATTDVTALALVRRLWEGVGMRVEEMPAAVHDAILARVSHAPHVLAFALVAAVCGRREGARALADYVGRGFLDTTRIAKSPGEVWRDVALMNAPALLAALAEFRAALDGIERAVRTGDPAGLARLLESAANARRALEDAKDSDGPAEEA